MPAELTKVKWAPQAKARNMRETLNSLMMLGLIVVVDWLGMEGYGWYQFVGLLRFNLDGVSIGGGIGGHVPLLAIVVGTVYAGGMLFTWNGKGLQASQDKKDFLQRAAAGFAKVLGGALIALASVAVLRYAWWLVVQAIQ